jgi:type II secretory pathway component GspD/PulD (secretin)
MRRIVKQLEAQKGVDLLTMPEVTTVSGRQVQIQAVDMRTVVTGINRRGLVPGANTLTNGVTNSIFQTQTMPFGSVLDVVPYLSTDGYTIQMTVIPSVTEFLGYDDPVASDMLPLPRFRIRQITHSAILLDGQTVLLGGADDQLVVRKRDGSEEVTDNPEPKKKLFVFVTPKLIDETGNPIHTGDKTPFSQDSVPSQPLDQK